MFFKERIVILDYTVASNAYILLNLGDGMSMFKNGDIIQKSQIDNEVVLKYIQKKLNGTINKEYENRSIKLTQTYIYLLNR